VKSGLENEITAVREPPHWLWDTLYPQTLALTSPTSDCRSIGIIRSLNKATELVIEMALRKRKERERACVRMCVRERKREGTNLLFLHLEIVVNNNMRIT
jgi:hypothetical protein